MHRMTGWTSSLLSLRSRLATAVAIGLLASIAGGCGKNEPSPSGGSSAKAGQVSPTVPPPAPDAGLVPPAPEPVPPPPPTRSREVDSSPADPAPTKDQISRWYEFRSEGQKLGSFHVVWAPSTWQGKPTVHDTTTVRTRSAREMLGTEDVFANESVTDVERSEDGTLWWMRTVTSEPTEDGTRVSTSETTWTGDGYDYEAKLEGRSEKHRIKTPSPAHVDAEALLGARIAAKSVKVGDKFMLRQIDVRAEKVKEVPVEVVGEEPGPGVSGDVPCTKLRQTDPEGGDETLLWIDGQGAFARVKELANIISRVSESKARANPVKPASFSITAPATPSLPRVFSAEKLFVDVHVRADADRPLPEFPESPWSRVVGVDGDDKKGYVVHVEMRSYDVPDAKATIPVTDPAFAKDLEPTLLMACDHPDVQKAAKAAVGDEKDARRAAQRIADFVYTLRKESPAVAEASAVEILRERQGDCSEHALLFVALCRAAGIPARRCSGFVCVGSDWGAHAWAEIWTGAWIGVDPTTDDVGTAARYLFYGYSDAPGTKVGTVSARARGRLRLVTTGLEEGDDKITFGDAASGRVEEPEEHRARHLLAGLEFRDIPEGWKVSLRGDGEALVKAADGTTITISANADQGMRSDANLRRIAEGVGRGSDSSVVTFAGARAVMVDRGNRRTFVVSSRRRFVIIVMLGSKGDLDETQATLEKMMAPSFTERPKAP